MKRIQMIYFYIPLFLVFNFSNCQNKDKEFNEIINKYTSFLKNDTKLDVETILSHFPNKNALTSINKEAILYTSQLFGGFSTGLVYSEKISLSEIESIKRKFNFKDSINYFSDSIFRLKDDFFSRNPKMDSLIIKKYYPYPTFSLGLIESSSTTKFNNYIDEIRNSNFPKISEKYMIPNDLCLYLIESKKGIFFKSTDNLNYYDSLLEWNHGYSRGITISRECNLICYWFMLW